MLCVLAAVAASPTMSPERGEDTIQIYFEEPESQDNRSPVYQVVEGYVDPLAESVVLRFTAPCGNVQYQLENLNDNSYVSGTVAGTGVVMIPLVCSSGHWLLTLTFVSGDIIVGEFTI